jgi:predicted  nucleic acid-binding Zn ribbon protein
MMLLFGEKAYQIASQEANPKHRQEWLRKAAKYLLRTVNALDTTVYHKKALMAKLEAISQQTQATKQPSWDLVYSLFSLSCSLLGFGYSLGAKCHTLVYCQDPDQHYTAHILRGGNDGQRYQDNKDAISVRQSVVEDLKKKGLDDFKISLVLNTTEYHVKQLRSDNQKRRK